MGVPTYINLERLFMSLLYLAHNIIPLAEKGEPILEDAFVFI